MLLAHEIQGWGAMVIGLLGLMGLASGILLGWNIDRFPAHGPWLNRLAGVLFVGGLVCTAAGLPLL